jgi:hypothetical protein
MLELGFLLKALSIGLVRPAPVEPVRGHIEPQTGAGRASKAPALEPYAAACLFVSFLRAEGLTGEIAWSGPRGIWNLYLWFCDEEGQTPIPENHLGAALGRILVKTQVRDRSKGKLRRLTAYVVA